MKNEITLAEFFNTHTVNTMFFTSVGNPTGGVVHREAPDNEVFENITTNPDFWELKGEITSLGNWSCVELQNCCDYLGNSILNMIAFRDEVK